MSEQSVHVYIMCMMFIFYFCSYKILFLDVLFPLSLKKIIFVDADLVSVIYYNYDFLRLIESSRNCISNVKVLYNVVVFAIKLTKW